MESATRLEITFKSGDTMESVICITGGEPMLHPQICDVIKQSKALGLEKCLPNCEIIRNGTPLTQQ